MPQPKKAAAVAPADLRKSISLAVLAPFVAFLIAGMTKVVQWDVGPKGYLLLAGFGAVGIALLAIPERARHWAARPQSSWADLKQTIGTMRVLVTIALIVFPLAILCTNDKVLSQFPKRFAQVVNDATKSQPDESVVVLKLERASPKLKASQDGSIETYAGRLVAIDPTDTAEAPATVTLARNSQSEPLPPAAAPAAAPGQFYVVTTTAIIDRITRTTVLPAFYAWTTWGLIVSSIFVLVVFCMEMISDLMWQMHLRTTATVRRSPANGPK